MYSRKNYKKKYSISRPIKNKSVYDNGHLVKRYGSIITHTTVPSAVEYIDNPAQSANQSYNFVFRLSAVTAFQDFANLYDQYKIRAVKVSFIPIANIMSSALSGYASLIYSTYDFNGEGTLPTKDQIREYQYCKWSPYGEIHTRYFYPRTVENPNGTKVGPQNWISTANPDVLYHGLLVNVSNVPSIAEDDPIYKIEVRYYLSFRNTK